MKCHAPNCKKQAVWLHTYYSTLSVCEEHFQKSESARALRSIPSKKRENASRENGKKGGRPRKLKKENGCKIEITTGFGNTQSCPYGGLYTQANCPEHGKSFTV